MPAILASLSVLMCMEPKGVLMRTLSPLPCLLWEISQPARSTQAAAARTDNRSAFIGLSWFIIRGPLAESVGRGNTPAHGRIRRWQETGSVNQGFASVMRGQLLEAASFCCRPGYTSSATPSAGRMVMSRRGWSTGAFRGSAMLAALGLVLSMTAQAQQPMDASQVPQPGQDIADPTQAVTDADPPAQVVRLSVVQGNVSVEPASINEFSPAEVNYPLTTGDRVWTDYDALSELQAGQLTVRMAQTTDLTVTAMTDTLAQFGLGQGSVHLRTYQLDPGTTTELDTPNVAVTVIAKGDVRVDVDPGGDWTVVTVFSGVAEVDGNGLQQTVGEGQALRVSGSNPVSGQWVARPQAHDTLDAFSSQRDQA